MSEAKGEKNAKAGKKFRMGENFKLLLHFHREWLHSMLLLLLLMKHVSETFQAA